MQTSEWEEAIVVTIKALGGRADLQQVYEHLRRDFDLSADDLRETKWGGRPAYQHTVRFVVSGMARSGTLDRLDRGVYAIPGMRSPHVGSRRTH